MPTRTGTPSTTRTVAASSPGKSEPSAPPQVAAPAAPGSSVPPAATPSAPAGDASAKKSSRLGARSSGHARPRDVPRAARERSPGGPARPRRPRWARAPGSGSASAWRSRRGSWSSRSSPRPRARARTSRRRRCVLVALSRVHPTELFPGERVARRDGHARGLDAVSEALRLDGAGREPEAIALLAAAEEKIGGRPREPSTAARERLLAHARTTELEALGRIEKAFQEGFAEEADQIAVGVRGPLPPSLAADLDANVARLRQAAETASPKPEESPTSGEGEREADARASEEQAGARAAQERARRRESERTRMRRIGRAVLGAIVRFVPAKATAALENPGRFEEPEAVETLDYLRGLDTCRRAIKANDAIPLATLIRTRHADFPARTAPTPGP